MVYMDGWMDGCMAANMKKMQQLSRASSPNNSGTPRFLTSVFYHSRSGSYASPRHGGSTTASPRGGEGRGGGGGSNTVTPRQPTLTKARSIRSKSSRKLITNDTTTTTTNDFTTGPTTPLSSSSSIEAPPPLLVSLSTSKLAWTLEDELPPPHDDPIANIPSLDDDITPGTPPEEASDNDDDDDDDGGGGNDKPPPRSSFSNHQVEETIKSVGDRLRRLSWLSNTLQFVEDLNKTYFDTDFEFDTSALVAGGGGGDGGVVLDHATSMMNQLEKLSQADVPVLVFKKTSGSGGGIANAAKSLAAVASVKKMGKLWVKKHTASKVTPTDHNHPPETVMESEREGSSVG